MTAARFVIGLATLAAIAVPHVVVGWRIEQLLARRPPPLRVLAGTIVSIGSLLLTAQLLGAVGWFEPAPLLVSGVVVAAAVAVAVRGRVALAAEGIDEERARERRPRWQRWAAGAAVAAVSVRWAAFAARGAERGISDVDSRLYHLPFAAEFVRTGSLARMRPMWPDAVHVFYPANSETIQAVGMLTMGRDVLAPLLNVGWFGLLLVAGWCAGLRDRVVSLTLAATAVVAGIPFLAFSNGGTALSDIAMLACLLSAVALWRAGDGDLGWLAVSALALGLSVGAKLTVAPLAAALAVLLVVTAPAARRRAALGVVAGALLLGCGFWFVRNLAHSGSPMPLLDVPLLPSVDLGLVDVHGDSVSDHLFDRDAWRTAFWPGIRSFFGWGGVLAAFGIAVTVPALVRSRDRAVQGLAMAGVVGLLGYLILPVGAWGLDGRPDPLLFYANLRYSLAAVAVLTLAGALSLRGASARARSLFASFMVAAAGYEAIRNGIGVPRRYTIVAVIAVGAIVLLLAFVRRVPVATRTRVVAGLVVVAALALAAGGPRLARRQLTGATRSPNASLEQVYQWAAGASPARIGYYLVLNAYPMYGPSWSNDLVYLGVDEARSGFRAARGCREFVDVVARSRPDYVVIGPVTAYDEPVDVAWMATQPGTRTVLEAGDYVVFAVAPTLDPDRCP